MKDKFSYKLVSKTETRPANANRESQLTNQKDFPQSHLEILMHLPRLYNLRGK